jgi:parallel beta-helix repeat protein
LKHARKAILALTLLVMPLLLAGVVTQIPTSDVEVESLSKPVKLMMPSYEEHTSITVWNDTAFHTLAGSELWDGDGSDTSPYIIEGYNFSIDGDCITLINVSLYFEIRGCYFSSNTTFYNGYGLNFFNVTHATIVDTFFVNKMVGVQLSQSPNGVVQNCTFFDISWTAIMLYESNGVLADDCSIYDSLTDGINAQFCNDSLFVNNIIHDLGGYGIRTWDSHFLSIEGNQVFLCDWSGIYLVDSPNSTIVNNVIYDNFYFTGPSCGIHLYSSSGATIIGNEIFDNARNGIYMESTDYVYIFENEIYGNSEHGIDAIFSDNGTVLQNNIHSNGWWPTFVNELCGVFLAYAQDWDIVENSIWNNTPAGVSLEFVNTIEITGNEIFDNTDHGILAFGANEVTVFENQINGNGWASSILIDLCGIRIASGTFWWIEGNQVYNNTEHGITIQGDNNTVVGNEVYDNDATGIFAERCYDNIISENIVYDNQYGIYVMNIRTNLTDNIIFDNEIGIYMDASHDCWIYGNDVGWNGVNGIENHTSPGLLNMWYNNVTEHGNHWSDYSGTGVYEISNGSANVNSDLYPEQSMNVSAAESIEYEITSDGNLMEWPAYALHPLRYEVYANDTLFNSGEWAGGNIVINMDGLIAGYHRIDLIVFHISGHGLSDFSSADVADLTPPEWIIEPSDQQVEVGTPFSVQFSAEDPSGIGGWAVNNTGNFTIDSTGLLTNSSTLPFGIYGLTIEVWDVFGNTETIEITVVVFFIPPTTPPPGGDFGTLILAIGLGGAGFAIIVVAVIIRKQSS